MPIPNSYWVRPGQLLAGEYPGSMSRAEAMERVQKLLQRRRHQLHRPDRGRRDAGLRRPAGASSPSSTCAIAGSPSSITACPNRRRTWCKILDLIDGELAAGRCVYVHCRAGIGRTGTTMGCHLIRSGLANEAALDRLQTLWQQCGRSRRWPTIPETDEQVEFVRAVARVAGGAPWPSRSCCRATKRAFVGLAIGDAVGSMVANSNFDAATLVAGGGLRDAGTLMTGASTAMTRALAESLIAKGGNDSDDQMQRYLAWTQSVGNIGVPQRSAARAGGLAMVAARNSAGTHDPANLDPHSLPRTLAVAMFLRDDAQAAIDGRGRSVAHDSAIAGGAGSVPRVGGVVRRRVRRRQ